MTGFRAWAGLALAGFLGASGFSASGCGGKKTYARQDGTDGGTQTPDQPPTAPPPPKPPASPDPVTPPTDTIDQTPQDPLPPPPPDTPNETQQEPLPPPPPPPSTPTFHMDGALQVNELQFKGTHNSYHLRPTVKTSPAWEYDMPTLTDQLDNYGVRAVELDLHWDGSGFPVYHWPEDPDSTCEFVTDCLAELRQWSSAHPQAGPLFVFFDLKTDEGSEPISNHLEDLENTIAGQWPREKIFTPDDFTGDLPDVRTAVLQHGWPKLDDLRGKVVFALLTYDPVARRYAHNDSNLHGRLMQIASGNTGLPYAGIAVFDDVLQYSSYIRQAALSGYLVRTRADDIPTVGDGNFPERFQAALASGANIILTDYPVPFVLPGYDTTIPGGTPERCNPVTARASCMTQP